MTAREMDQAHRPAGSVDQGPQQDLAVTREALDHQGKFHHPFLRMSTLVTFDAASAISCGARSPAMPAALAVSQI